MREMADEKKGNRSPEKPRARWPGRPERIGETPDRRNQAIRSPAVGPEFAS